MRYDITDPQDPDVFLPKLWTCLNVAVDDGDEQFGVLHQVAEATESRTRAMAGEIEQLHRAVETRDIIGQAKGMLMERFTVDAAAAFDLLAKLSQGANIRLVDIARQLVEMDHASAP